MSVHVMSWVLKHCEEPVAGRRLVLLVLADKSDNDGRRAFPSVETIAHEARMSERGTRYALRALEESGRITRTGTHPQWGTHEYAVVMSECGAESAGGNPQQHAAENAGAESAPGGNEQQQEVSQIAPKPSLRQPPLEEATPLQQPVDLDPSIAAFEVQCIFDAWLTATDRESSRTKFSDKRRKIIKAALKSHGYDDCLVAVENIGRSTEARNGYGRGTRFDDISHALGSAEQIEKWRDWQPPPAGARNGNGQPRKGSLDEAYARQERLKAQAQRMAALDDADAANAVATAQIEETNQ